MKALFDQVSIVSGIIVTRLGLLAGSYVKHSFRMI